MEDLLTAFKDIVILEKKFYSYPKLLNYIFLDYILRIRFADVIDTKS